MSFPHNGRGRVLATPGYKGNDVEQQGETYALWLLDHPEAALYLWPRKKSPQAHANRARYGVLSTLSPEPLPWGYGRALGNQLDWLEGQIDRPIHECNPEEWQ